MKVLANVIGAIGLIVGAWIALAPVTVDVPFGDGRCGPAVIRHLAEEGTDDPNERIVIDRCEDLAADRLLLAGVAVAVGLVGFGIVRLAAWRHDLVLRRRRRARRLHDEEEAAHAAALRARAEEAIARDAALRG